MSYSRTVNIVLGADSAGLTLYAILYDEDEVQVGGHVTTGFIEIGGGDYAWEGSFTDGFEGFVKFYNSADDSYLAFTAVSPVEIDSPSAFGANVLITPADIRPRMPMSAEQEQILVPQICNAAVALFEAVTMRKFSRRSAYVQRWSIERPVFDAKVWADLRPIETIALVEWDQYTQEDDAVAVDAAAYQVDREGGRIERTSGVWLRNVKATITGGYNSTTLPADIKEAMIQQVVYSIERQSAKNIAVSNISGGMKGGGLTFLPGEQCPVFAATANRYRDWTI